FTQRFASHVHMVALYALFYNLIRIHKALRVTPDIQAGVADRVFGSRISWVGSTQKACQRSVVHTARSWFRFQTETLPIRRISCISSLKAVKLLELLPPAIWFVATSRHAFRRCRLAALRDASFTPAQGTRLRPY